MFFLLIYHLIYLSYIWSANLLILLLVCSSADINIYLMICLLNFLLRNHIIYLVSFNITDLKMLRIIHKRKIQSFTMSSKLCDSRQSMNGNMCNKCWCGLIKSSNLQCPSSIHSPPSSILISKSPSFFIHPQFSILNSSFPSSVKSTGYLAQKVLKIAGFPTKCPQVPLAAFSRSAWWGNN